MFRRFCYFFVLLLLRIFLHTYTDTKTTGIIFFFDFYFISFNKNFRSILWNLKWKLKVLYYHQLSTTVDGIQKNHILLWFHVVLWNAACGFNKMVSIKGLLMIIPYVKNKVRRQLHWQLRNSSGTQSVFRSVRIYSSQQFWKFASFPLIFLLPFSTFIRQRVYMFCMYPSCWSP